MPTSKKVQIEPHVKDHLNRVLKPDGQFPFFCFSFCLTYLIKHNQSLAKFVEGRNISEEKVTALVLQWTARLTRSMDRHVEIASLYHQGMQK